jgi:hypothetical protein
MDSHLAPIFVEVEAKYEEVGVRIIDEPEWHSGVKGGKPTLSMADTKRHMPSFAHELRHLRLSGRGYRHILAGGNLNISKRVLLSQLLSTLDNELQHHRMYADFVAAGFDSKEFYAESDDRSFIAMRKLIKAMKSPGPSEAFLSYVALIAPGGGWPIGVREDLLMRLERAVTRDVWQKLLSTKNIIDSWTQQQSLDPTSTIAAILETLGDVSNSLIAEDLSGMATATSV